MKKEGGRDARPPGRGTHQRRGMLLLVVLVIIALLALIAASFSYRMDAERMGIEGLGNIQQARLAAESGLSRVLLLLRDNRTNMDFWYSNPDAFRRVPVWMPNDTPEGIGGTETPISKETVPNQPAWRYSVVAYEVMNEDRVVIRYGLTDEAGKLNINFASRGELLRLVKTLDLQDTPPEALVDTLIDWRDADSDLTTPAGAETPWYMSLDPNYRAKNRLLESVDELLMVRNWGGQFLFGEDYNRNGYLDENEDDGEEGAFPPDNGDGQLDRGLARLLTVYSWDWNTATDNKPRSDINSLNWAQPDRLPEHLQEELSPELIDFLAQAKQRGFKFRSVGELWNLEVYEDGSTNYDDAWDDYRAQVKAENAIPKSDEENADEGGDQQDGENQDGEGQDGEGEDGEGEDGGNGDGMDSGGQNDPDQDGDAGNNNDQDSGNGGRRTGNNRQGGNNDQGNSRDRRNSGRDRDNAGNNSRNQGNQDSQDIQDLKDQRRNQAVRTDTGNDNAGSRGRDRGGRSGGDAQNGGGRAGGRDGGRGRDSDDAADNGENGDNGRGGRGGRGGFGGRGGRDGGQGGNDQGTGNDQGRDGQNGQDGEGGEDGEDDESRKGTPIVSPASPEQMSIAMDRLTVTNSAVRVGQINVNTASVEVLQSLIGMTAEDAKSIVQQRQSVAGPDKMTPAWLVTSGAMKPELFAVLSNKLTARSIQFTADVVGFADHVGTFRRIQAVIEMRGHMAQVRYYRDISSLGIGYPVQDDERSEGFAFGNE